MNQADVQFKHFLKLLEDQSPAIQNILRHTLLNRSLELILNGFFYDLDIEKDYLNHLSRLKRNLHFPLVFEAFKQLLQGQLEDIDLEKSVLVLAYWQNPELVVPDTIHQLEKLTHKIKKSMPDELTEKERLFYIKDHLFYKQGFIGNNTDYYNPDNSFIDKVLQHKKGIPISLSALFILIARRFDIGLQGVSMPAHFIVKYDDAADEIFLDPFYKGKIYSRDECVKYLAQTRLKKLRNVLDGCPDYQIVIRMMRNINLVFSSYEDNPEKIREIKQMIHLLENHFVSG